MAGNGRLSPRSHPLFTPANSGLTTSSRQSRSRSVSPISRPLPSPPSQRIPPQTPTRRRAYSWRGEKSPYEDDDERPLKKDGDVLPAASKWIPIVAKEARCVLALVGGAAMIQWSISFLVLVASYAYPVSKSDNAAAVAGTNGWWEWFLVAPSVAAGCLIRGFPQQVIANKAPGFIYASAWLLMGIQNTLGSLPHIPSRICEAVLGRLSPLECLVVVTVQLVCCVSTVKILQYCFFSSTMDHNHDTIAVLSPVEYTSRSVGGGNPWIVDYFHELFVNTVFTVALQVAPVLLRLNRASPLLTILFVYPLYTYGVDRTGHASTLSPSILFALSSTRQNIGQLCRCIPQLLSGILAGEIMRAYFPDDPKRA